nr:hypothetical protein [Rhizobium sp. RHZ02]
MNPAIAASGIEIDFSAGFGESGAEVPDTLKRALLCMSPRCSPSGAPSPSRTSQQTYPLVTTDWWRRS